MLRLPTRCLVVLIGPSAAGKSTWAAAHFRPEQVVASDDLRAMVGESHYDQRAGSDAFDLLDRILAARLRRRLLTVVDTLGLDADRRAAWVRAAHDRGMPAIAVIFDTEAAVIRSRNKAGRPDGDGATRATSTRAATRPVPDRVLARQIRLAAIVTPDLLSAEGFDRIEAPDTDVAIVPPAFLPQPAQPDRQPQETRPMRFGLQIPRFDPPAAELRAHLRDIAVAAEEAGFDSLWLMDHHVQIPQVGREWEDMLEAYTTLGFLAGVTERIRLGTLVTGITYRNLALLAKQIATLDVLSGGRAIAGLGAAWFEREHVAYGFGLPDVPERYALLRDALELLPVMWGPGTPTFEGRTTSVTEAICYPRPIQPHIPILIGGSGERTTLRLVAEHADACNLFGDVDTVRHKIEVLHGHCADVERDAAEVEVTTLGTVLAARDRATLDQRVSDLTPPDRAPETTAERVGAGTVEDQIIRFRAFADAGVDTAIINMPVYDTERIAELASLISALSEDSRRPG